MNTKCDNTIIGFMLFMNQLACICRIAAMVSNNDAIEQAADIIDCIADTTYCSVCACMQTQQEAQINFRNASQGGAGPPGGVFQPPPVQQMRGAQQVTYGYGTTPPQAQVMPPPAKQSVHVPPPQQQYPTA